MYSPSRPPALSKNLPGELWQVGKTVTQGELEVVNPGYVFTTISSIQPGEGGTLVHCLVLLACLPHAHQVLSSVCMWQPHGLTEVGLMHAFPSSITKPSSLHQARCSRHPALWQ